MLDKAPSTRITIPEILASRVMRKVCKSVIEKHKPSEQNTRQTREDIFGLQTQYNEILDSYQDYAQGRLEMSNLTKRLEAEGQADAGSKGVRGLIRSASASKLPEKCANSLPGVHISRRPSESSLCSFNSQDSENSGGSRGQITPRMPSSRRNSESSLFSLYEGDEGRSLKEPRSPASKRLSPALSEELTEEELKVNLWNCDPDDDGRSDLKKTESKTFLPMLSSASSSPTAIAEAAHRDSKQPGDGGEGI